MIERIIKQFLFEQRRYTAVVKAAPASSTTKAKSAGAVYAFFVRFRFKPGKGVIPTEDQLYKELATIISENTEVGKSSKYANGKYVYVVSNRLKESDNRLLFNVWIYPEEIWEMTWQTDLTLAASQSQADVVLTAKALFPIGKSKLVPIPRDYSSVAGQPTPEAVKLEKLAKTINTTPVSQETPDLGSNVKMNQEYIPGEETPGEETPGEEIPGEETVATKIEYPYTVNSGKIIYTTGPTDDWVYSYDKNTWWGTKKLAFEQWALSRVGKGPLGYEIKNKTAIDTLNKLANITPTTVKQPVDVNSTDKKIVKPDEKKIVGTKFTPAPAIFKSSLGTGILLFNWDNNSKKWKRVGTYRIEKKSPGNKIGQSKDKTMTLIQFQDGKYWVVTNLLK